ncbi:MAG: mismatch repair protein MutL [Fibrobacteria bacterium]|nr:mismatch repair protein MutL [Fibrobacteria bacterium]
MPTPVIQQLSPHTIQKIAAGEVIERPSNVVKELVENALDAGATKISVNLEDGGKELIRVADNGFGMTRDDLLRCWLPHTTSKITVVEDLDSVSSFGFRGEALASMAAVSELVIETRHWEEEVGTRLRVTESRQEEIAEIARGQGTTMSVRNLFRNNPVRRKFLGSAKAETARITALVTRLSLAHPGVSFRIQDALGNNSRELLHLPEGTLRRRAGDVLGVHLLEDLVEVDWQGAGIHVQGYVSEPQRFSTRPSQQHFFVNRRHVYNPLLTRALAQAYEVVPPGRHPVAALFLTLSPSEVDVNVHPTKREVRFLNEAGVFWSLSQALQRALRGVIDAPALELATAPASSRFQEAAPAPAAEDTAAVREGPAPARTFAFSAEAFPAETVTAPERPANVTLFPAPASPASFPPVEFTGVPCLQIHGSFILVAVRGGYLLVNQRAAHERILYEKALEDLRRPGRFSAQQLLFPELVEFSAAEARAVEQHLAELRTLGFDLEPFGPNAFQLRGSPADVPPEKAQGILQAVTGRLIESEGRTRKEGPEELLTRVARAYARAAAIPLDEPLDAARMGALVDGLFATQNPYVTPAGLPVLIRYSLEEIRRRFGLKAEEE